jgi:RNA-splicing ligase RtcB
MEIPVSIYAHDTLASFMASDRAIDQAVNVKALQDIVGHVAVLLYCLMVIKDMIFL